MNAKEAFATLILLNVIASRACRRKCNINSKNTITRRFWIRPSLRHKSTEKLLNLTNLDDEGLDTANLLKRGYFKSLVRLTMSDFENLHRGVFPMLKKMDTKFRHAITPLEKLAVTLRFLATGDNYNTLETMFQISKSSISLFIPQTCRAIIMALKSYIKVPQNAHEWKIIANEFQNKWQFPNCLGAIDGRHCPITSPKFSGTDFYNYKNFFSIVLMAVVDANYQFIYIDVGAQGRMSDGATFNNCSFKEKLENNSLNLPGPQPLCHGGEPVPFVFLGDDAFPLKENLMKPIKGNTDDDSPQRKYNYRLSRARRVVENAFGIVSARFRILRKPMQLNPTTATLIITTCCYLHNYIRRSSSSSVHYTPAGFIDDDNENNGLWRNTNVYGQTDGLFPWNNIPRKSPERAKMVRQRFIDYFSTPEGSVPWPIPHY